MRRRFVGACTGIALLGMFAGAGIASATGAPGSLDTTFGHGGITLTSGGESSSDIALQSNGDILVSAPFGDGFAVLRYLPNGTLDTAFGANGGVTTTINGDEGISALVVQPNGDIVATGYTENNSTGVTSLFLARYLG